MRLTELPRHREPFRLMIGTGIQAIERQCASLPMAPGKRERQEFEYIRHGTQTLIASA